MQTNELGPSLVRLFSEINLHPVSSNEMTEKHKREGILEAAEVAEHYEKQGPEKKKSLPGGSSSPPTEDEEAENGKKF